MGALNGLHRRAQRHARRRVERQRGCRQLAHVVHARAVLRSSMRARTPAAPAPQAMGHANALQRLGPELELRRHLQHHAVLVGLGEDGGNQALAKGVVQRRVDAATVTPRRLAWARSSAQRPGGPGFAGRWPRRPARAARRRSSSAAVLRCQLRHVRPRTAAPGTGCAPRGLRWSGPAPAGRTGECRASCVSCARRRSTTSVSGSRWPGLASGRSAGGPVFSVGWCRPRR